MNQILMFRTIDDSKQQLNKVIKFFSAFIIIFGIIFIVEGILGFLKLRNTHVNVDAPKINIERLDNTTILKVSSTDGISVVKYYWNIINEGKTGKTTEERVNGQKDVSIKIDTLNGTNELCIEVLDVNGNIIKYNPVMISYNIEDEEGNENSDPQQDENGIGDEQTDWENAINNDKTKPTIKLEGESGKIKINATDDLKMSYVIYRWNDEQELTITGLSEDEKTVEESIDVLEGTNKLTVIAIDRAGNQEVLEKEIKGVRGPSVKVIKENGQIVVNVEDEEKITKIIYNFNGEEITLEDINEKTYEFKLDLVDGENYIILEAYRDDVKSTYKGKTTK